MDTFFLHRGDQRIPNPLKSQLNPMSIPLLSIGHNLSHLIWAPPDPTSYACQAWLTCLTNNARSWQFFSHLHYHASITEWDRSALLQNLLPFKGALIKPLVSRSWVPPSYDGASRFSAHGPLAPNVTECLRLYHFSPVRPMMRD